MRARVLFDTGNVQLLRVEILDEQPAHARQYRLVLPYPFAEIPPTNEVTAAWAELDHLELSELLGKLALAHLGEWT